MNAQDMIARNKRVAEMKALMETPLDPNLDYFDATGSIKVVAEHIRGLHKLIDFLSQTLVAQGNAIIELRSRQAVQQGAIETLANMAGAEQEGGSGLIGFEKPKLEIN